MDAAEFMAAGVRCQIRDELAVAFPPSTSSPLTAASVLVAERVSVVKR
jgi:hypothetical protein